MLSAPSEHSDHMQTALSLAKRGLGNVWPNPAVGCVIVKDGRVVGRGWTQPGGRPHSETGALKQAGSQAKGATAYVTLEPCNHHGQTPPCTDALIEAGISKVVISCLDPDSRVSGTGAARLKEAGIQVEIGIYAKEGRAINCGFFSRIEYKRPVFTLKVATTLDGRIATQGGESQWITGPEARRAGHLFRARHDAVMVGSGTVVADDPTLTSRLPGVENKSRPRIVMDGRLRLGLESKLVKTIPDAPLWIVTSNNRDAKSVEDLAHRGAQVIEIPADENGHPNIHTAVTQLGKRGLTRILVEGGGQLVSSLLEAEYIDQIAWFRAPSIMGEEGIPSVGKLNIKKISELSEFKRISSRNIGEDCLDILDRRR